jgi:gas vesicle protein
MGTCFGFMLGGILGLLLTPQSGNKNRQWIADKYQETSKIVEEAVQEKQDELQKEFDLYSK